MEVDSTIYGKLEVMINEGNQVEEFGHLVWDGDCGFCKKAVGYIKELAGDQLIYSPYQQVAGQFSHIPIEAFQTQVYLFKDGKTYAGASAIFHALAMNEKYSLPLKLYQKIKLFRVITDFGYSIIAKNRYLISRLTKSIDSIITYGEDRQNIFRKFLIILALCYFVAFFSFLIEWEVLFSEQGLSPYSHFKSVLATRTSLNFFNFPGLFWFIDDWQWAKCIPFLGLGASVSLFFGFFPRISLFVTWISYLSILPMGAPFSHFQWDNLLVEAGFLALLTGMRRSQIPYGLGILALQILAFKVMFSSGIVKVINSNSAWRNLDALLFHFQTQPLPHYFSWFWHQLPDFILKAGCFLVLVTQLIAPFGTFLKGRIRKISLFFLIGLQLLIILSGNYNFFNFLTIALLLLFLTDNDFGFHFKNDAPQLLKITSESLISPVFLFIIFLSLIRVTSATFPSNQFISKGQRKLLSPMYFYHLNNGYGLFANMTLRRPEIIFEVSTDKVDWRERHLRYKPGRLNKTPPFVMPLQPRVDWQLWFAALRGKPKYSRWVTKLAKGLLNENPYILELFEKDIGEKPKYVRARIYDYKFSNWEQRMNGTLWNRSGGTIYLPTISID